MRQQALTKKLAVLAMLSALAYLVMFVGRIPAVPVFPGFVLNYEPKDVIIAIGGFLFGPLSAFAMSAVVSLVEMITVSSTGWIGCVMNIVSTCSFVCTAAFIYHRKRGIKTAALGLAAGLVRMTAVMILWNYFLTPIYTGMPRDAVAKLLIPAFLPFNLLKGGLNAGVTMLIYKPVTVALRKSRLLPVPENAESVKGRVNIGAILLSCFVIITCVLFILVFRGNI